MALSFSTQVVPTAWRERILKRHFEVVLGKMLQSTQGHPDETEERYLRSANIQWEGVETSDIKTMWLSPSEKKSLRLESGDILVNEGGDAGRCAIWVGQIAECYFQNSINRVRPLQKGNGRFLYYWLYNLKHAGLIDALITRITIAHLTADKLERIPFPDVSQSDQKRIAAFLDSSNVAIDAAVDAKRRQLETLDSLRTSIITLAVTRGLHERPTLRSTRNVWMSQVPKEWDLVSLKRISKVQTGLTLGKVYEGPLVERPYLRVANVQDGHLDLEDVTTIQVPGTLAQRLELKTNDVLMTEGGDLDKLGRGFLWSGQIDKCLHQNHIFAVRCFEHKLLPRFLAYLTTSQYGRAYFEATGKRTTNLAATNSTKVGLFPIPLPSREDQKSIIEFLDERTYQLKEIQRTLQDQIETLLAYRKSLIHECVTGKRRITDADLKRVGVDV